LTGVGILISLGIFSQEFECMAKFGFDSQHLIQDVPINVVDNSVYNDAANTSWHWTFENGMPSESDNQSPVVSFLEPGEYVVCLTINEANCESSICDTITILEKDTEDLCDAEFSYYCDGTTHVQFINGSYPPDATYFWNFGDGYISNDDNPIHIYASTGFFEVCLFIETDGGCSDSICHVVFVGADTDCQAFYDYSPGFWPNTYSFDDLSNGDVVMWYWDFDDGTYSVSSTGFNHTFYNAGEYNTCLHILTSDGCESSYCQTIIVENTISGDCVSSFITNEEYCSNCFSFENISTGIIQSVFWDFGDGQILLDVENPSHVYIDSGSYQVCLTIYTSDGCVNTFCDTVYAPSNLADSAIFISGYVRAGSAFLPKGMAVLFRETASGEYVAVQTCLINYGFYYFEPANYGNYLIYAVPYFEAEYYFPVYFPTYYGNDVFWENANVINVNEPLINYLDINLEKCTTLIYGESETDGYVNVGDDADFEYSIFGEQWFTEDSTRNRNLIIGPARNIPVLLLDNEYNPYRFVLTDSSGYFSFSKLPLSDFILYPEKAGLVTYPASISFNESRTSILDRQFIIRAEDIFYDVTDIPENLMVDYSIYPNPVIDYLNIRFKEEMNMPVQISVFNSLGQKLMMKIINQTGSGEIKVDFSHLNSGMYNLEISFGNNQKIIRKIVK